MVRFWLAAERSIPLPTVNVLVPPMDTGPAGVVTITENTLKSVSSKVFRLLMERSLNVTDWPLMGVCKELQFPEFVQELSRKPVHAGGGSVAMKRHCTAVVVVVVATIVKVATLVELL